MSESNVILFVGDKSLQFNHQDLPQNIWTFIQTHSERINYLNQLIAVREAITHITPTATDNLNLNQKGIEFIKEKFDKYYVLLFKNDKINPDILISYLKMAIRKAIAPIFTVEDFRNVAIMANELDINPFELVPWESMCALGETLSVPDICRRWTTDFAENQDIISIYEPLFFCILSIDQIIEAIKNGMYLSDWTINDSIEMVFNSEFWTETEDVVLKTLETFLDVLKIEKDRHLFAKYIQVDKLTNKSLINSVVPLDQCRDHIKSALDENRVVRKQLRSSKALVLSAGLPDDLSNTERTVKDLFVLKLLLRYIPDRCGYGIFIPFSQRYIRYVSAPRNIGMDGKMLNHEMKYTVNDGRSEFSLDFRKDLVATLDVSGGKNPRRISFIVRTDKAFLAETKKRRKI